MADVGTATITVKAVLDEASIEAVAQQIADGVRARVAELLGVTNAVAAPVEAPVARVFNVGDPEPADRETIVLRGNRRDMDVRISYGKGGSGANLTAWWCVRDDPRYNSHASWSYWLENHGPLIEVTEDAPNMARMPRVFDSIEDIPSDVNLVSDCDGDTWSRNGVCSDMGEWPESYYFYAPFTEVLTP